VRAIGTADFMVVAPYDDQVRLINAPESALCGFVEHAQTPAN
jgi:hypothetical protein